VGLISNYIRKRYPHLVVEVDPTASKPSGVEIASETLSLESMFWNAVISGNLRYLEKDITPKPATHDELQMLVDAGLDLSMFDV
jgi:hypothetical protein